MLEFLTLIGQFCAALLPIGAVVSGVWVVVKKPWRQVRRTFDLVDDLSDVVGPKGEELKRTIEKVNTISSAVGPNGGKSLFDEIQRQGRALSTQGFEFRRMAAQMNAVVDLIERPVFQTDHLGHWIRVNRTFDMTFGYPPNEVLGMGWAGIVALEDRDKVVTQWEHAVEDRRVFRARAQLLTRTNLQLLCDIVANPIVSMASSDDAQINWVGSIQIVISKQMPAEARA